MRFDELPREWRKHIQDLQTYNRNLRKSVGHTSARFEELPQSWQRRLTALRQDNAKLRVQRNEARAELAALRAERV